MDLWLDTDIGNDIDDAVCLAWLLRRTDIRLAGISTVSGPVARRSAIASAVLRASGAEAPIFNGLAGPILGGPGQPQCGAWARLPDEDQIPWTQGGAAAALAEAALSRPEGTLTLLAIGPLTNVAAFCLAHPEAAARIGELRIMGGVFLPGGEAGAGHSGGPGSREWNMLCDPAAAAIAFGFPWRRFSCVGLDVTRSVRMEAAEVRRRFRAGGPALSLVADFAEAWFEHSPEIVFHDPLAAASLLHPGLIQWQRGRVRVEWRSEALAGLTSFEPDENGPVEIACTADAPGFFEAFFAPFSA